MKPIDYLFVGFMCGLIVGFLFGKFTK